MLDRCLSVFYFGVLVLVAVVVAVVVVVVSVCCRPASLPNPAYPQATTEELNLHTAQVRQT